MINAQFILIKESTENEKEWNDSVQEKNALFAFESRHVYEYGELIKIYVDITFVTIKWYVYKNIFIVP